jgi:hypothetical protein
VTEVWWTTVDSDGYIQHRPFSTYPESRGSSPDLDQGEDEYLGGLE